MIRNYEMLKNVLIRAVQESGLDVGGAYYVLLSVVNDLEKQYYASIKSEIDGKNNVGGTCDTDK